MRILRRVVPLMFLVMALAFALGTRTEITGAGAAVQVSDSGTARWVQIIADAANASAVRVGDAGVTSTTGAKVAPGGGLMLPHTGLDYRLTSIYIYVANGDKVSVLWGN